MKVLVGLLQALESGQFDCSREKCEKYDEEHIVCPVIQKAAQLALCDSKGYIDYDATRELRHAGYRIEYGDEGIHYICTKVGYIRFEEM